MTTPSGTAGDYMQQQNAHAPSQQPPPYEQSQHYPPPVSRSQPAAQDFGCSGQINKEYPKSIPGIIKITEMVICVLVIITAAFGRVSGFVYFTAFSAVILTLIIFWVYMVDAVNRFSIAFCFIIPVRMTPLALSILFVVVMLCYALSAILCAATGYGAGAVLATILSIADTVLYGSDALYHYQAYRQNPLYIERCPGPRGLPVSCSQEQQQQRDRSRNMENPAFYDASPPGPGPQSTNTGGTNDPYRQPVY